MKENILLLVELLTTMSVLVSQIDTAFVLRGVLPLGKH